MNGSDLQELVGKLMSQVANLAKRLAYLEHELGVNQVAESGNGKGLPMPHSEVLPPPVVPSEFRVVGRQTNPETGLLEAAPDTHALTEEQATKLAESCKPPRVKRRSRNGKNARNGRRMVVDSRGRLKPMVYVVPKDRHLMHEAVQDWLRVAGFSEKDLAAEFGISRADLNTCLKKGTKSSQRTSASNALIEFLAKKLGRQPKELWGKRRYWKHEAGEA